MTFAGNAETAAGIVVLGSVNMDLVVRGNSLPKPGETVTGGNFYQAHGGKGANQAVAAQRLGWSRVTFIGAVGDDRLGAESRASLKREGINVNYLMKVEGIPTGVALIMVDASGSGENQISVASGANKSVDARLVDSIPDAAFASCGVFLACLEVPLEAVRRGLERARAAGAFTILNPAPVDSSRTGDIAQLLTLTDLIIPNEIEAAALSADLPPQDMARQLLKSGARAVIITLGENGCIIAEGDGASCQRLPAQPVERVVDTTAAGDCFCGAIAASLAQGKSLPDAARFATEAAALCVACRGAQPSIPTFSELD